jgi:hypothetical protein
VEKDNGERLKGVSGTEAFIFGGHRHLKNKGFFG